MSSTATASAVATDAQQPLSSKATAITAAAAAAAATVLATNLGFPRIGAKRELKKALEAFWGKQLTAEQLRAVAAELRAKHWTMQRDSGIADGHIPSNDFTYYDHVLSTAVMVGAIPARYGWDQKSAIGLDTFFAMARGNAKSPAMEMTKWFDTNYHYLVPEFTRDQQFRLCAGAGTDIATGAPVQAFAEALALGIRTRPVLVGPVSFLLLGKLKDAAAASDSKTKETGAAAAAGGVLALLDRLVPVYEEVLKQLAAAGAEWVQLDEPCFACDRSDAERQALTATYTRLRAATKGTSLKLMVTTYFDDVGDNLATLCGLPVSGVHLDLARAPQQLDAALKLMLADSAKTNAVLSIGVVDGRNVWRNDLSATLAKSVSEAVTVLGAARVMVAPSCSLLHTPVDLDSEVPTKAAAAADSKQQSTSSHGLDAEVMQWLSFAKQKLAEVAALAQAASVGTAALTGTAKDAFAKSDAAAAARKVSKRIHDSAVKERTAAITADMLTRKSPFPKRIALQRSALKLPLYPTTTIGSFPQTPEIRERRATYQAGKLTLEQYTAFLKQEIAQCVKEQEALDIDVLVHGEPERNDMVEYFADQLNGVVFTRFGWVQSYGSRCVKPPIIVGDVSRPKPMTVDWTTYAQSLTKRPMKGMLTGPITVLQWSFVRDDQPRSTTANQLALALRDEVVDLEKAGIAVIQIDEPALREGLPLRRAAWPAYLRWAVDAFRVSASGVGDATQIHTHMCYAEFQDIIEAVAALDADVISIETSRSQMELLDAFGSSSFQYPNDVGPGVYDIHSPRIVTQQEMEALLRKAATVLRADQLWVNPDCGLKTRKWEETKICLKNMVAAAKTMRAAPVAVAVAAKPAAK